MRLRAVAALLACVGCSGPQFAGSGLAGSEPGGYASRADEGMDGGVFRDASTTARVASAETAWLVAHLADSPAQANPRETDAVRRLSQQGPDGVLAVSEVFRVGDAARLPFARRVVERVATRRCRGDRARAAWVVTRVERGTTTQALDPDAGILWQTRDDRWANEAVDRLRAWARDGAPCDAPALDDAGLDAPAG